MSGTLIVSLHDVHPGSLPLIQEQREALLRIGLPCCSQLVVPHYHHRFPCDHSSSLVKFLKMCQDHGDEIVLHGYYHDRKGFRTTIKNLFWTRFYTNAEAEFLDINEEIAEKRFRQGRIMLETIGLRVTGFIAPAWLLHPRCVPILIRLGFRYTTTLRTILPIDSQKTLAPIPAHSLCWSARSRWRRWMSLRWNAYLYPRAIQQPILRIALHPADFRYYPLRTQILHFIKSALDHGFRAATYAEVIDTVFSQ